MFTKKSKLQMCIWANIFLIFVLLVSLFLFNENNTNYLQFGWSKNLIFISIIIDTPLKYFLLCFFILIINISEVLLNEIATPILQFSTYNPYKNVIKDFSKNELEFYSNIIYFIQTIKKFLQIFVILSQFDILIISLLSSQFSAYLAINILLSEKIFLPDNSEIEINYDSLGELTPIVSKINL